MYIYIYRIKCTIQSTTKFTVHHDHVCSAGQLHILRGGMPTKTRSMVLKTNVFHVKSDVEIHVAYHHQKKIGKHGGVEWFIYPP